ncbi:hypothetical protein F503_01341 [Ophiostoma piceae UAMH 11346]|uniref:ubiquitinyl hydrolase 1 n=1 Tax=Ophiostoma piceae (strain UAMH 11346) TaxID=1262450 RepID=S3BV10_OPHP1|nr:hypothetical protein F503_01341 [Ophiostoma piceae UAMH 11346]
MATLEQAFNHIVLPPEIPGKEDANPDDIGYDLVRRLRRACDALKSITGSSFQQGWQLLDAALEGSQHIIGGPLTKSNLYPIFAQVAKENGFACLHMKEQNAALIMYRLDGPDMTSEIVFEAFESAPRLEKVIEARDVLSWNFPSRAVKIPLAEFWTNEFTESFAVFLEKADAEPLSHLAEKIHKAGVSLSEVRDVVKPDLITHMLLSLLQSMGGIAIVDTLQKRIRDDANLSGGQIPWRRLPFWLVLRVAAQRRLGLLHGLSVGYAAYKILSCMVLSQLLQECTKSRFPARFPIALTVILQKKLGRKMAKLETYLASITGSVDTASDECATIQKLIDSVAPTFKASIQAASAYVNNSLATFKSTSLRKIPQLPSRADESDLILSLPSSGRHLDSLLLPIDRRQGSWVAPANHASSLPGNPSELPAVRNTAGFTKDVVDIAQQIVRSSGMCAEAWKTCNEEMNAAQAMDICSASKSTMASLMEMVKPYSIDSVELNSALILEVFDNWAIMDTIMVSQYPLLREYCPVFPPDLLNLLQLPDLKSMQRLRKIQRHLDHRHRDSAYQNKTIFAEFDADCFPTRFSKSSEELQELLCRIIAMQDSLVSSKTAELGRKCDDYDDRTREMNASECSCFYSGGQRQVKGCVRCYKWRVRRRIKISTFEHYLPADSSISNALVFELGIPHLLSIYMQTSWAVLTRLAYPQTPRRVKKVYRIQDGKLGGFETASDTRSAGQVTLASSVKTFDDTHYREVKMKATLDQVVLPLGARYRLFDAKSRAFISDFDKPLTIAHFVHTHIPESLRATVMPHVDHPPTVPEVPSSYECVANRPRCPHHLSIHEFEAQQRLLSAKATRWLTMLVELGCSNINFGKEDSMLILCHLAHEAGPRKTSVGTGGKKGLGSFHLMFADNDFVQRLLAELNKRLAGIKDNWRETNMMIMIITLLMRVNTLADQELHKDSVMSLLKVARLAALGWVNSLRDEMAAAKDPETSKRASEYGFRAALLCRRTFELFERNPSLEMSGQDLEIYVRASIAVQQNIFSDANTLPAIDKACLKRDSIMAHRLKNRVSATMRAFPDSLSSGILHGVGLGSSQPMAGGTSQLGFEPWTFLTGDSEGWIVSWLADGRGESRDMTRQCYTFHYTQGHLLVDGKTMGKLPDNIRASHEFTELFGDKHMLTYPSNIPGMSHRLMSVIDNHLIHLGQHGDKTIVLSYNRKGHAFEFVPRRHFITPPGVGGDMETATYDLPRRLVDDCFHWVNRATRSVEVRKQESQWYAKESDWYIDIPQRKARRRNVFLVDPFSKSCKLLYNVFRGFEDVQRLTVFQPISSRGGLSAELRHLELSFEVKDGGVLSCKELGAEVDPNQDAGTLYGYQSMIVLRDAVERDRRSIILPLAEVEWKRDGCHISVVAKADTRPQYSTNSRGRQGASSKAYARFEIDSVLGRLTCPPEPRILYTKAQLHAFTSTPLPDPLTGRTGEEEAVHTLLSGRCQPWKSLPLICHNILHQIMMLVPVRQYYPRDMRVLQQVSWSEFLPVGMQSDRYGRIVRLIISQADTLRQFEETGPSGSDLATLAANPDEVDKKQDTQDTQDPSDTPDTDKKDPVDPVTLLEARGEIQRMRYECSRMDLEPDCPVTPIDKKYLSLGRVYVSPSCDINSDIKCKAGLVFQVTQMLRKQPPLLPMKQNISTILNRWETIGGFIDDSFDPDETPLSSYMDRRFLSEVWGGLVQLCRNATDFDLPRVMFTLASLAFAPEVSTDAVRLLAAYSYMDEVQSIEPPPHEMYSGFKYKEELVVKTIMDIIEGEYVEYVAEDIDETGWRNVELILHERRAVHLEECRRDGKRLAQDILSHWPHSDTPETSFMSEYVNVHAALSKIEGLWERLSHNKDLSEYVTELQSEVDEFKVSPQKYTPAEDPVQLRERHKYTIPSLAMDVVCRPMASSSDEITVVPARNNAQRPIPRDYLPPTEFKELSSIVEIFASSADPVRSRYGKDLATSLRALNSVYAFQRRQDGPDFDRRGTNDFTASVNRAVRKHTDVHSTVVRHFSEGVAHLNSVRWLETVGLWPRLTPVSVLELLRSDRNLAHGEGVFPHIVHYGTLVTNTQRLYRLRRATAKGDERRTKEELENTGHTNWHPREHPDWLLMEIDANMLIREEQVTVAQAMIEPASQSNSVFQLNMGKGKTSVILPMVLAVLADGNQLARMIVPKSLILPTAQVIQTRLGGLVGRQVRHLTFSRRLISADNTQDLLSSYVATHMSLVASRGMLIAAPEHILAFKLCGLQCLADGKTDLGMEMVSFQTELEQTLCRDVLDESDFTLAVRTQLVYPSGDLTAIDGAPYRWQLVQQLLALVQDHAVAIASKYSEGLKVIPQKLGGYPTIHILHQSIEDVLHDLLVQDVCNGIVPLFRLESERSSTLNTNRSGRVSATKNFKQLLRRALVEDDSSADIAMAAGLFADVKAVENGLLLVRGLIKHGILMTCLKKRWNVQYGLHPGRWPIAVPFEARGVPSERSEFGHPDVSIIFTCLAFYYSGVNMEQFRKSLEHVLHHVDDPATEYEKWSSGDGHTHIPPELQNWNSINVDDQGQVEKLWTHLRYARSVINHYLNKFVFPQHSRQFSVKLQASAWDLPLITHARAGEQSLLKARTTGFSGTNDNKSMLPLTIKQDDLPGFSHTNAEVSAYFLEPRNRKYVCTTSSSKRWTEREFVRSLRSQDIRVLIDAGAFILELSNESLARAWLKDADGNVKAAVFFDEQDNRAMVVFRETTAQKVPLVSSPYADRLDECIVYFDEAHTRGVDLQLPPYAKGAVTLALGQTRDHTAQAALRLRQLATTQSVVFYAPPEVDQSIRDLCRDHHGLVPPRIESPHVVAWLLEQTCKTNEQLSSLYAAHGRDFCQRTDAIWTHRYGLDDSASRQALLEVLEQPERQTLETMYGSLHSVSSTSKSPVANAQIQGYMAALRQSQSSPRNSGTFAVAHGAFEEVEQEREVEVQVEEEDIPERRVVYSALSFPGLAMAIRTFVKTGSLPRGDGYLDVFANIAATNIGERHGIRTSGSKLYISTEFGRTIETSQYGRNPRDDFLRPAEWLLWCPMTETGVVVISEEVEQLMPLVRKSEIVHLVTYAAAVTRSMLDFSSLKYLSYPPLPKDYAFPPWLAVEMGILGGRLYMRYNEAQDMIAYLEDCVHEDKGSNAAASTAKGFCTDPSSFLLEWLPLRRTAQDILHTPAAYICQGRPLRRNHAFFLDAGHVLDADDTDGAKDEEEHSSLSSGPAGSSGQGSPNQTAGSNGRPSSDTTASEEDRWGKLQDMKLE